MRLRAGAAQGEKYATQAMLGHRKREGKGSSVIRYYEGELRAANRPVSENKKPPGNRRLLEKTEFTYCTISVTVALCETDPDEAPMLMV
jgi:hypothetical protein